MLKIFKSSLSGLDSNLFFLAVLSAASTVFFITFKENIPYLYMYMRNSSLGGIPMAKLVFLGLLFQIGFLGISCGLLLGKRLGKRFDVSFPALVQVICGLLALTVVINLIYAPPAQVLYLGSLPLGFAIAILFGACYAKLFDSFSRGPGLLLFFLMIGSALGVFAQEFVFTTFPHIAVYLALIAILQIIVGVRSCRWKPVLIVLAILIGVSAFLSQKRSWGQGGYPFPGTKLPNSKVVESRRDRNGILDISFTGNEYVMLTNKQSRSTVAIKGDISRVEPQAILPYQFTKAKTVLVIGIGGGQDIVAALYYGAQKVVGVDLDGLRVQVMRQRFAQYSGGLLSDPRVTVVIESAREFLRKNTVKFDLIVIQRPWTSLPANPYFYYPSEELFKEEAIDAYLSALNKDGLVYFALPWHSYHKSVGPPQLLSAFRAKLPARGKGFNIFRMRHRPTGWEFFGAIIASPADLKRALSFRKHINWIYSTAQSGIGGKIREDTLFPVDAPSNTDKLLFPPLIKNQKHAFLFSLAVLVFIFAFFYARKRVRHATYFYLGVGYELALLIFVFWFPLFLSNFATVLPVIFTAYFFLSGLGYLVAGRLSARGIIGVSLGLATFFLLWWQAGLLLNMQGPVLFTVLLLFIMVGFAIALPFGFLILLEAEIAGALFIDYVGAVSSMAFLVLLPNLSYLALLCCVIYALVAVSIAVEQRAQY